MEKLQLIGSIMLILLVIMSLYSSNEPDINYYHSHTKHLHPHSHDFYYNDIYDTIENFNITQSNNQTISVTGSNNTIRNVQNCNIRITNNRIYVNEVEIVDHLYFDFEHNGVTYQIAKVLHNNCKVFVIRKGNNLIKVFSSN
jgi:hypothetical protein